MHEYRRSNREVARTFRKLPTRTEWKVWRWLRDRRFGNWKFRRQYPIGPFIADFYCDRLKLVVEIDGATHDEIYDAQRTRYLAKMGIEVVRLSNAQIFRDADSAAQTIIAAILRRRPLTRPFGPPSPEGEGTDD